MTGPEDRRAPANRHSVIFHDGVTSRLHVAGRSKLDRHSAVVISVSFGWRTGGLHEQCPQLHLHNSRGNRNAVARMLREDVQRILRREARTCPDRKASAGN
ncbi:hypothetical protein KM043_015502 [Ampulex compressa]|nr:hypothetical protein KM043_015502 [Ampulex compressa]